MKLTSAKPMPPSPPSIDPEQLLAALARIQQLETWAHGVDATLHGNSKVSPPTAHPAAAQRTGDSARTGTDQGGPPSTAGSTPRVAERVAAIEKAISEEDTRCTTCLQLMQRVTQLESRNREMESHLTHLRLRPIKCALVENDPDVDLETSLNWRIGMIESATTAQASDLFDIKQQLTEVEKKHLAQAPPIAQPHISQRIEDASSSSTVSETRSQMAALHQNLSRLAVMVQTCWAKQQSHSQPPGAVHDLKREELPAQGGALMAPLNSDHFGHTQQEPTQGVQQNPRQSSSQCPAALDTFTVLTLNTLSMADRTDEDDKTAPSKALQQPGQLKHLSQQLKREGIKVAFLQETRLTLPDDFKLKDYHVLSNSAVKGVGGLITLVTKESGVSVINSRAVGHRILAATISYKGTTIVALGAHAPIRRAPVEQHQKFAREI
eukprot:2634456-Amphidinium_carterae.1